MKTRKEIETIVPTLRGVIGLRGKKMIRELSPSIVRKLWGGKKLEAMKGLSSAGFSEPIGETLEIFEAHLPYLAKFIDTSEELSIQVHPGDDYAQLHENSSGKTECWVILEAAPKAGVYLGLKSGVSKKILQESLAEKKEIDELLNFYPVKRGDFFYVTAGSIHAIGKDITLAEVQQNSGITYRVWDWNRVDDKGLGRELHVEKSLDVISFDQVSNTSDFFRIRHQLFEQEGLTELCEHPQFHLFLLNMKKGNSYQKDLSYLKRPMSILNLNGKIFVNHHEVKSFGALIIEDENSITIEAHEDGSLLLIF